MKKYLALISVIFGWQSAFSQCFPDRHNTSWFDSWISCESSLSPNQIRGEGHWIMYDFGQSYALNELKIWNINDPDLLDYGAQHVAIDYSTDGINWKNFDEVVFPKATGMSNYEGTIVAEFNKLSVRYLLFTVIDNYGGTCSGFSEMRVGIDSTTDENADICMLATVYPNPFQNEFSVILTKKCLGDVFMAIEDASGRTIVAENNIQVDELNLINGRNWAPGIYYVCLRNGNLLERIKIVKF